MFGRNKRQEQQDAQIPYEVYATMQQPTARRRAWFVKLAAMLIVVTIVIFGGLFLKRTFLDDKNNLSDTTSQSQASQGSDGQASGQPQPPQTLVQSPQQNSPAATNGSGAAAPTTLPQSNAQNTTTVRKPE